MQSTLIITYLCFLAADGLMDCEVISIRDAYVWSREAGLDDEWLWFTATAYGCSRVAGVVSKLITGRAI